VIEAGRAVVEVTPTGGTAMKTFGDQVFVARFGSGDGGRSCCELRERKPAGRHARRGMARIRTDAEISASTVEEH